MIDLQRRPKDVRNIGIVLRNLYLRKSVGYIHNLIDYVLNFSIANDK